MTTFRCKLRCASPEACIFAPVIRGVSITAENLAVDALLSQLQRDGLLEEPTATDREHSLKAIHQHLANDCSVYAEVVADSR